MLMGILGGVAMLPFVAVIVVALAVLALSSRLSKRGWEELRSAAPVAGAVFVLVAGGSMVASRRPEAPRAVASDNCGGLPSYQTLAAANPRDGKAALFYLRDGFLFAQVRLDAAGCPSGRWAAEAKVGPNTGGHELTKDSRALWSADGARILLFRDGRTTGGDAFTERGEVVAAFIDAAAGKNVPFSWEEAARFDFGEPLRAGADPYAEARRRKEPKP